MTATVASIEVRQIPRNHKLFDICLVKRWRSREPQRVMPPAGCYMSVREASRREASPQGDFHPLNHVAEFVDWVLRMKSR